MGIWLGLTRHESHKNLVFGNASRLESCMPLISTFDFGLPIWKKLGLKLTGVIFFLCVRVFLFTFLPLSNHSEDPVSEKAGLQTDRNSRCGLVDFFFYSRRWRWGIWGKEKNVFLLFFFLLSNQAQENRWLVSHNALWLGRIEISCESSCNGHVLWLAH